MTAGMEPGCDDYYAWIKRLNAFLVRIDEWEGFDNPGYLRKTFRQRIARRLRLLARRISGDPS